MGVGCIGWDLPRVFYSPAQKHLVGKDNEAHFLGLGGAGTCWGLFGGYQCHAISVANSGLRTSRLVEGPGQSYKFKGQECLGMGTWTSAGKGWPTPEEWKDQV